MIKSTVTYIHEYYDRSTQKDVNEDKLDDKHDGNGDCTALSEENHGVSMTEKSQADSFGACCNKTRQSEHL